MKKLFTLFMLLAGMSVHAQQGYCFRIIRSLSPSTFSSIIPFV